MKIVGNWVVNVKKTIKKHQGKTLIPYHAVERIFHLVTQIAWYKEYITRYIILHILRIDQNINMWLRQRNNIWGFWWTCGCPENLGSEFGSNTYLNIWAFGLFLRAKYFNISSNMVVPFDSLKGFDQCSLIWNSPVISLFRRRRYINNDLLCGT